MGLLEPNQGQAPPPGSRDTTHPDQQPGRNVAEGEVHRKYFRPCGLHGVEHGIDPAKRRLEPLIAHVQQLVGFGPYRLIAGSAVLCDQGHLQRSFGLPAAQSGGRCPGFKRAAFLVAALVAPGGRRRAQHPTQAARCRELLADHQDRAARCSRMRAQNRGGGCFVVHARQGIVEAPAGGAVHQSGRGPGAPLPLGRR